MTGLAQVSTSICCCADVLLRGAGVLIRAYLRELQRFPGHVVTDMLCLLRVERRAVHPGQAVLIAGRRRDHAGAPRRAERIRNPLSPFIVRTTGLLARTRCKCRIATTGTATCSSAASHVTAGSAAAVLEAS
jgi:hypothetical protein